MEIYYDIHVSVMVTMISRNSFMHCEIAYLLPHPLWYKVVRFALISSFFSVSPSLSVSFSLSHTHTLSLSLSLPPFLAEFLISAQFFVTDLSFYLCLWFEDSGVARVFRSCREFLFGFFSFFFYILWSSQMQYSDSPNSFWQDTRT